MSTQTDETGVQMYRLVSALLLDPASDGTPADPAKVLADIASNGDPDDVRITAGIGVELALRMQQTRPRAALRCLQACRGYLVGGTR